MSTRRDRHFSVVVALDGICRRRSRGDRVYNRKGQPCVSRTLDGLLFARLRTRTTATIVSEFL